MDLCLDGFDDLGFDGLGPSRGWSMKRGHRKRLDAASCRNPKKMGKASEEVGLGRSAAQRSVNSGSRNLWRDPTYLGKYGSDYHPQTRRNNLRRRMREAVYESEELESDWEDCIVLSLEHVGSLEAKWKYLEVASVCSSTTAGFDSASTASDFGWEFLEPTTPSRACTPKIDISPWQAALRRAELTAKEYAQQSGQAESRGTEASQRRRRCKRATIVKSIQAEMQKLAKELRSKYQVHLNYDLPSAGPTTPFEKLRWKFLKDHANAFCASLSVQYLRCGRQWNLKPTPLPQAVEDRFLSACARASEGELQPALHGTDMSNLSSIYSQGLLIPGERGNGVRIANGSVHGVGIYTAYVKDASLSWLYSRGESRPVLVCGVLDPRARKPASHRNSGQVAYTHSARIFFKDDLVSPLFEASLSSIPASSCTVPTPTVAALPPRILPPDPAKAGPRTRLRPTVTLLNSAQAFLARRAARKRQT
ncbi:unnamed protein product [Symbiodinium microadriaticum]|nr:unnamed protein product [Symbiodinium sp. KB8]CAE7844147.1 unnamed protein product [Symbiodinium microadriaticum]